MLRCLSLRDFVIVDTLDLDFQAGFTVLTGETGAGKSILLDALALALGERAEASVVREGAQRAEIAVEFALTPPASPLVLAWLQEHDLNEGDETVLLRRTVDATGRSKAFINGRSATLAQLREVGDMLVDIHGQHAHQLLLKAGAQRQLLDHHAGLQALVSQVSQHYRTWQTLAQQCAAAERDQSAVAQERERLAWQVGELEKCAPQPDEWQQIQTEHTRLSHAAQLLEGCQGALASLEGGERGSDSAGTAVLPALHHMHHRLQSLAEIDPSLRDALEALAPAQVQLEEVAYVLKRYGQKVELDPSRLAEVEARLQTLHSLARKYRVAPDALPSLLLERQTQLAALEAAQDMAALQAQAQAAEQAFRTLAQNLSTQRAAAAQALSLAVTEAMQGLSMAGGRFEIALHPLTEGQAYGLEQVEFMVAAHIGVPPKPLAKVASGGELARISLAISVIASAASLTPTLVFDEVDSGIGGGVAEVVGQRLRELGSGRQVLCVTHLPQVAAQGHQHVRVSKTQTDGVTRSALTLLTPAERVSEIARMLGGTAITATTLAHAKEMLART